MNVWRRLVPPPTWLIGPMRSELGFEVLYWLPWVARWRHQHQIDKAQMVAISRGGAAYWYDAGTTIELYEYWPPEALRLETIRDLRRHQNMKQLDESVLERALYHTVAARLHLRQYRVLHPRVMYAALSGWWADHLPLQAVLEQLRMMPFPVPALPLSCSLPDRFIAVRFYERHTWPLTEEIREWCGALVGAIAKERPVVVLGSAFHHDDHVDLGFEGPNITSLIGAFALHENLALQSAVIAKSQAFVGTYGGMMQLAVRLGKPVAGFFLKFAGTAFAHKTLTEYLALHQGTPCFIGRPQDADFVRQVVGVPLPLPMAPSGSSSGGG